jgi:hypothetical protein
VQGRLAVRENECRVRVLPLPELEGAFETGRCVPRGAVSPDRRLVARCDGERVELVTELGEPTRTLPGCAPAWRPDGVLTMGYERAVVHFVDPCGAGPPCARTLIGRSELEHAARLHPRVPDLPVRVRALVDGIAWLSTSRAAVLLSIRVGGRLDSLGPLNVIAFFADGRLEEAPGYFRSTGGRLGASPRGTYVTMTPDVILRSDGTQMGVPQHLRDAVSYAWSRDERFLAVAGRFAVTIIDVASLERYDRDGSGLRSVTLPISALDLEWR